MRKGVLTYFHEASTDVDGRKYRRCRRVDEETCDKMARSIFPWYAIGTPANKASNSRPLCFHRNRSLVPVPGTRTFHDERRRRDAKRDATLRTSWRTRRTIRSTLRYYYDNATLAISARQPSSFPRLFWRVNVARAARDSIDGRKRRKCEREGRAKGTG